MVRVEVGLDLDAAHIHVGTKVREAVFPEERNILVDAERRPKAGLDAELGVSFTSAEADRLPVEFAIEVRLCLRDEEPWTDD